jgi:hypothetical protein
MAQEVWVHNERSGSGDAVAVYLGDATVTSSNGLHVSSDATWQGFVGPGDELWAVTGGGSEKVSVMIVRQD